MRFRTRQRDPLGELDLFAGCSPTEIDAARQQLTLLSVDAGTLLMRQGGFGLEFLIIAHGEATVSIGERTMATLGRGDVVGEMALIGRSPRTATVRAVTSLTFYVANAAEFSALLEVAPSVREHVVGTADARAEHNRRTALAA